MRTSLECLPCFIRQALDATKIVTKDEKLLSKILKKVLQATAQFDLSLTPPEMGQMIHRIIRQETGNQDPYILLKERSTKRALELSKKLQKIINKSIDPFCTAVRFSIAGNIMDFGVKSHWDEEYINDSFTKALYQPIDEQTVEELYQKISTAKQILVLGDNAGETVFDRLLIEQFPKGAQVTYVTKESPISNDATIQDAVAAKLHGVAMLITNGIDAPGTILNQCSKQFLKLFNSADVVISKGQGNFETLNTCERQIYFLFQVKCSVIATHYNFSLRDWKVTTTTQLQKERI